MKNLLVLFVFLTTINFGLRAQSNEERGLEIANLSDEADEGFESMTASVTMILRNGQGEESTRLVLNQVLEGSAGEDKALIRYYTPDDLSGTATVVHSKITSSDIQWLYLPSVGRVKEVSSNDKAGPFMGSEFAYEDIYVQPVGKYSYKFIKTVDIGGDKMHVVKRVPNYGYSGYTKQLVWFNEDRDYQVEKIEYYGLNNTLKKTLTYSGYNQYLDRYWRADKLIMVNHQTEKETELIFKNYKFQTGLTDLDFSPEILGE